MIGTHFGDSFEGKEGGDKMKDLGVKLLEHHSNEYGDVLPLAMLFEETHTKFEKCIIRPFLDRIFRGKDNDEPFLLFLLNGYEKITINAIVKERANAAVLKQYMNRNIMYHVRISFLLYTWKPRQNLSL